MTRYNSPPPQTSGRPAMPGQQPLRTAPAGQQPKPPLRPGQAAFPSQGYAADAQAAAHRDPYAALRPEGYGYAPPQGAPAQQPADPYGLAGYTAPQPPLQGYGTPSAQPSPYGQGSYDPYQPQPPRGPSPLPAAQPYSPPAPSFGTQPSAYGTANGYAPAQPASHAPFADSWGSSGLAVDPRDYGAGYGNSNLGGNSGLGNSGLAAQTHWDGAADPYFADHAEPALAPPPGYQNGPAGSFDQSYAEDDAQYDDEPRGGGSWKKIVGVLASMVIVGGVLTLAYTSIMGSGNSGPTPVVKSAAGPSKVKPSDPGGKQFAYTDSKVMGRLGDGSDAGAAADAGNGVKKVPVVVVGRDGSIQPPASGPAEQTRATVAAPGLTVIDGFGDFGPRTRDGAAPVVTTTASSSPPQPPPVKMVTGSADAGPPPAKKTASVAAPSDDPAPAKAVAKDVPAPPKKEKVAAVTPAASSAATGPQPTGAGYVAVLASVPASGSSRIDALKQFADMQQKYTTILQNKTPDVQEANLGTKGTYHRLLVGPPGSRDAASQVCTQLKAEGYSGCWVTAY